MCGDESSVQIGIASYRAAISDASKLRLYTRQDRLGMLSTRPGTTGDEFPLPMRVHPAKHDAGTTRWCCPASATRGDANHLMSRCILHRFTRNMRIASTIPQHTAKSGKTATKTCPEDETKHKGNDTKTRMGRTGNPTRCATKINTALRLRDSRMSMIVFGCVRVLVS